MLRLALHIFVWQFRNTRPLQSNSPQQPKGTVLFVDDDAKALSAIRRLFHGYDLKLYFALNAHDGLKILAGAKVDLVVSDFRMPEMDGLAFLDKVQKLWPQVLRVLLSGYAQSVETVAAINRGDIHSYITKPWQNNALIATVLELLKLTSTTPSQLEPKPQPASRLSFEVPSIPVIHGYAPNQVDMVQVTLLRGEEIRGHLVLLDNITRQIILIQEGQSRKQEFPLGALRLSKTQRFLSRFL